MVRDSQSLHQNGHVGGCSVSSIKQQLNDLIAWAEGEDPPAVVHLGSGILAVARILNGGPTIPESPTLGILEIAILNQSSRIRRIVISVEAEEPSAINWHAESKGGKIQFPTVAIQRYDKSLSSAVPVYRNTFDILRPGPFSIRLTLADTQVHLHSDTSSPRQLLLERNEFSRICSLVVPDFDAITAELIAYFAHHPEDLHRLTPRAFEELLSAVFANQGYRSELGPGWNDGGVDIRLYQKDSIGEILTLVQAKKYSPDRPIRLEAVAALSAIVDKEKANRGLFVTTSRFLPQSSTFAAQSGFRLVLADSQDIAKWCAQCATH
jgi:hypothetical protein